MKNFTIKLPTEVIFGKDTESTIGAKIKSIGSKKVLIHYGGGSVKKSGLLDKVIASITDAGLDYVELGGVEPNPKLSLVRKGIEFCKENDVDFILAVGGGSVIDSTKSIAMGLNEERDVWDMIMTATPPAVAAPFGVVLTLSAAGSETSNSQVITNDETLRKRGINFDGNRPLFAFMNPENTYSVSKFQTGCGIVDIMMHTLERYFTPEENTELVDEMAQALLRNVMKSGSVAIENPCDYAARATLMWAGSLSHNGLFGTGKTLATFPVHQLEHEVSGLFDRVAHGAGLSALFPAWSRFVIKTQPEKFAKFAVEVMDVCTEGKTETETALEGIVKLENYYSEIGMPITFKELEITSESFDTMINGLFEKFSKGLPSYGEFLDREQVYEIFSLCN